jgi:hypothetical protein
MVLHILGQAHSNDLFNLARDWPIHWKRILIYWAHPLTRVGLIHLQFDLALADLNLIMG